MIVQVQSIPILRNVLKEPIEIEKVLLQLVIAINAQEDIIVLRILLIQFLAEEDGIVQQALSKKLFVPQDIIVMKKLQLKLIVHQLSSVPTTLIFILSEITITTVR